MPLTMGRQPDSFTSQTDPGPRVHHVIPTALGRSALVFARALVDQLGGRAGGHTLVSLFDGESGVRVDHALGLPGGAAAARDLRLPGAAALAPMRVS